MAKQIIILERVNEPSDNSFRVGFWASVPAARIAAYANANAVSAFKNASAPEIAAIQAGQVVEMVFTASYPAGTALAFMTADLISQFNAYQASITAKNPSQRYGTFYDGTSWTNAGTA